MPHDLAQKDKYASMFTEAVKSGLHRNNVETLTEIVDTRHVTQCDRRIVYRMTGCASDDDKLVKNLNESAIKAHFVDFLDKKTSIFVLEKSYDFADSRYNMLGNVDALLKMKEFVSALRIVVLYDEIEVVRGKGAFRKDIVDTMLLSWLAQTDHGFLIYIDVITHSISALHVTLFRPVIDSACDKCAKMTQYKIRGGIPERPYKNKNNRECRCCEYCHICW